METGEKGGRQYASSTERTVIVVAAGREAGGERVTLGNVRCAVPISGTLGLEIFLCSKPAHSSGQQVIVPACLFAPGLPGRQAVLLLSVKRERKICC